ncbi:hypothetical protein D3C78_1639830 [compost metagenome]
MELTEHFKAAEIQVSYKPSKTAALTKKIISSRSAYDILTPFFSEIIEYKEASYLILLSRSNCFRR